MCHLMMCISKVFQSYLCTLFYTKIYGNSNNGTRRKKEKGFRIKDVLVEFQLFESFFIPTLLQKSQAEAVHCV